MVVRYQGRSAYLKPSGSISRTFEGNDLVLLPLVVALEASRGSGAESNLFWCLWPWTGPRLGAEEGEGDAPETGNGPCNGYAEVDPRICGEDRDIDLPCLNNDFWYASSLVTGGTISNDGYASFDARKGCRGDGEFVVSDLSGFREGFPSGWGGVDAGLDPPGLAGRTGSGVASCP